MTLTVPTKTFSILIVLVNIVLLLPGQQKYSNKEYNNILAEAFVPTSHYHTLPRSAITTSSSTSTFGRTKRKIVSPSSSLLWFAESPEDSLFSDMKSPDMKIELESYGISTKSMFDKKDFEKALKEARLNALVDRKNTKTTTTTSTTSNEKENNQEEVATSSDSSAAGKEKKDNKSESKKPSSIWKDLASAAASAAKEVVTSNAKKFTDSVSSSKEKSSKKKTSSKEKSSKEKSSTSSNNKNNTRQQRYDIALKEGAAMKISTLKKELTDRGISTVSFFEKSDLINAYANAIADNNDKRSSSTKGTTNNTDKRSRKSDDTIFDPSYKLVKMRSFDPSTMILPGDVVIDIAAA